MYVCGPLETFLSIMKLFQSEIQDPENYAIFYLDVYAESLVDRKPWQNSDSDWADPIKVFKVRPAENTVRTHVRTRRHTYPVCNNSHASVWILICSDSAQILCGFTECGLSLFQPLCNWRQEGPKPPSGTRMGVSDN